MKLRQSTENLRSFGYGSYLSMTWIYGKKLYIFFISVLMSFSLSAQVIKPAHIFSDNMVLQREKPVKIWGWSPPQMNLNVEFAGQIKSCSSNEKGEWMVMFDPLKASSDPRELKISGKNDMVVFKNVLVGDVWVLGGQSNMEFDLYRIFQGDVEVASANFPEIRLMSVPRATGPETRKDFEALDEYDSWFGESEIKGRWLICSPETVRKFSGLGYIFGRRLYMATRIPIGLIDVSVGGTTVEAWLSPEILSQTPEDRELLKMWKDKLDEYNPEKDLQQKIENWKKRSEIRKKQGLEVGPKPTEPSPSPDQDRNYPGSSYKGMLAPFAGLTVKGILFHQGYNNALGDARPRLYAINFAALITDWRNAFRDKELPFGIIEFSAGGEPQTYDNYDVSMLNPSPFIREGQFKAYKESKNVGYVCAYDQQVNWYHPQKKVAVGERIARWALSEQYGMDIGWEPALCVNIEKKNDQIIVTFNKEVKTTDDRPIEGFALAGKDRHFYPAAAEYLMTGKDKREQPVYDKSKLVVRSDDVPEPAEVRYAWARCPLGNLVNNTLTERIIPVPLFRSDNWDYPEAPYSQEMMDEYKQKMRDLQQEAKKWDESRRAR